MSAWLFAPVAALAQLPFSGSHLNVNAEHIAHSDTLAWSLMGVLGLTLGMVTACGVGIYRQFRKPSPESELLEELRQQIRRGERSDRAIPPPQGSKGASWEKPGDWWKHPPVD